MQERFDIHAAPARPLRAERRARAAGPGAKEPDAGLAAAPPAAEGAGLLRSTLLAAAAAGAILVAVVLPAEYDIDPTGVGGLLGLTEMGEIKRQLAEEAAAEDQALADAAAAPPAPVPAPAVAPSAAPDPDLLARLDRIEASVEAIATVVGADMLLADAPEAEPLPPAVLPVAPSAREPQAEASDEVSGTETAETVEASAPVETAEPVAAAPEWRDEETATLAPGEGIEIKLVMEEGAVARYAWSAGDGLLNFDTHGDGGGRSVSYEAGRAVPADEGTLTAAFDGNHGWFWRNRTDAPVTLTLRTGGDYAEVRR